MLEKICEAVFIDITFAPFLAFLPIFVTVKTLKRLKHERRKATTQTQH